jgi:glycine dehydrogenase
MYAVYHGPRGLRAIAERVHRLTSQLADGLRALGCTITHDNFFDTVRVEVESGKVILEHAAKAGCNLRALGSSAVGISFDETSTPRDIEVLMAIFRGTTVRDFADDHIGEPPIRIPHSAFRNSQFLTHLQHARYRDRNAAVSQKARITRSFADDVHDPARLMHDETQRHRGNVSYLMA